MENKITYVVINDFKDKVEEVVETYREMFEDHIAEMEFSGGHLDLDLDKIKRKVEDESLILILPVLGCKVLGYCAIDVQEHSLITNKFGMLNTYIVPDVRGHKIGQGLLNFVRSYCGSVGMSCLVSSVPFKTLETTGKAYKVEDGWAPQEVLFVCPTKKE